MGSLYSFFPKYIIGKLFGIYAQLRKCFEKSGFQIPSVSITTAAKHFYSYLGIRIIQEEISHHLTNTAHRCRKTLDRKRPITRSLTRNSFLVLKSFEDETFLTILPLAVGSDWEVHSVHGSEVASCQSSPSRVEVFMFPHILRAWCVTTANHSDQRPCLSAATEGRGSYRCCNHIKEQQMIKLWPERCSKLIVITCFKF